VVTTLLRRRVQYTSGHLKSLYVPIRPELHPEPVTVNHTDNVTTQLRMVAYNRVHVNCRRIVTKSPLQQYRLTLLRMCRAKRIDLYSHKYIGTHFNHVLRNIRTYIIVSFAITLVLRTDI